MPENDIKIYKLSYSGTFEEQTNDNPLELFTLYSILAIYSIKAKKMYIWVSKNATHTLKLFIPQIRELFSQKYPNLRILRNITIESGGEPLEFFKLFKFDKNALEENIIAQEKIIEPINNEIKELNEKIEGYIKEDQYHEAIQASEKLLVLSKQINDKSLQNDQEELIDSLKKRQGLKSFIVDIEKKALETEKKLDNFLIQKKIQEAHELINDFKLEIQNKNINLMAIPIIEKLILKEENAWHAANLEEEKQIKKLSVLEKNFNAHLKKEDFSECEKIIQNAIELVNSVSDDTLAKKWNLVEKKFKKQKFEHEEKQEQLKKLLKEMETKAKETKKKFEVLLTQKKIVKAHMLVNNFKLELKNKDIDLATLPVAEKLFLKEENIWKEAKLEEEQSMKQLSVLEEDYENLLKEENYDKCEEIFQNAFDLIDSILDDKIIKKWNTIKKNFIKQKLEHKERQKKLNNQFSTLQKKINDCIEKNYLTELINNCRDLIELAKKNKKPEIIEEYSSILEDSEKELEETKEIVDTLNKEILLLKEKGEYKKGISKIKSMLEEIDGPDFITQTRELENLKEELIAEYENKIKINEELKVLEDKLNICQESNRFKEALKTCEKIININRKIGNEELVKKFVKINEEIKNHHKETIEIVNKLIDEIIKLQEKGKFKEGIEKIDSIIEEILIEEFPKENSRLTKIKEELEAKNKAILKFHEQLNILEEELSNSQNENNLHNALNICKKIIQVSQEIGKDEIVMKYDKIMQELEKNIDKKRNMVDTLLKEISNLKDKNKLEEIITKIDLMVDEIPESIFSKQKEELFKLKNEIINENENIKKINEQINELEENFSICQKENDLHDALNICKKIIQISKDIGKDEIVAKYDKITQELEKNIDKKRNKVDSLLKEISNLKDKNKLEEIITKIDLMIDEIPESIFSKQKEELLKTKKEVVNEIENSTNIFVQIKELEDKIQGEKKIKNFDYAKNLCDEIIKISIENDKIALATKYTNLLKEINEEIESSKMNELKGNIEELSIKGIESLNNSLFQESMIYFEKIINLLEKKNK